MMTLLLDGVLVVCVDLAGIVFGQMFYQKLAQARLCHITIC